MKKFFKWLYKIFWWRKKRARLIEDVQTYQKASLMFLQNIAAFKSSDNIKFKEEL